MASQKELPNVLGVVFFYVAELLKLFEMSGMCCTLPLPGSRARLYK